MKCRKQMKLRVPILTNIETIFPLDFMLLRVYSYRSRSGVFIVNFEQVSAGWNAYAKQVGQ